VHAARPVEGVVKFEAVHRPEPLDARVYADVVRALCAWREVLARLRLVGQEPGRYEGAGFGNVSARVGARGEVVRGRRRFLITGTQTGGRPHLSTADFCIVEQYDLARNRVASFGPAPPSSESMTHGAIYDVAPAVRAVLHAHAPEIWRRARALRLPVTRDDVEYGTPEMAREVQRLYRETALPETRVFAMGGHEDGVVAFGRTADEAGEVMVRALARACGEGWT
jgi:ribulose-5-phosphate 4-epimerase/fuculose-1-phosphate aldolase